MKNKGITVSDQEIHINKDDYFSTDIAKYKNSEDSRFLYRIGYAESIRSGIWGCGNNLTIRILTVL